jgi:hypothetical protein
MGFKPITIVKDIIGRFVAVIGIGSGIEILTL